MACPAVQVASDHQNRRPVLSGSQQARSRLSYGRACSNDAYARSAGDAGIAVRHNHRSLLMARRNHLDAPCDSPHANATTTVSSMANTTSTPSFASASANASNTFITAPHKNRDLFAMSCVGMLSGILTTCQAHSPDSAAFVHAAMSAVLRLQGSSTLLRLHHNHKLG